MELSYIREFVYLADTLSFKQTADYFYVSRSVISRHLSTLEETLGAKLVERSSRTVKLTSAGETFYRDAVTLLRDYETALEHVRAVLARHAQVVRIGYLRNTARTVLVQFARLMKKEHPSIKLSLDCMEYRELRSALDEGSVDIALGVNVDPTQSRHYRSTLMYTDQFYAIMSEDNPLARQEGASCYPTCPPTSCFCPTASSMQGKPRWLTSLTTRPLALPRASTNTITTSTRSI